MKLIRKDGVYSHGLMGATPKGVHFVYLLELGCDTLQDDQPLPEEYLLCLEVAIRPALAVIARIQFWGQSIL